MGTSSVCRGNSHVIWRSLVAALLLMVLIAAAAVLVKSALRGDGKGAPDGGTRAGARRQRRDAGEVTDTSATSTPDRPEVTDDLDKSGDYFPEYHEVGGRAIDWDSEQMSTDGVDIQSTTDFIDDDDDDYDESTEYDYADDEEHRPETSKSNPDDVQPDDVEEAIGEDVNSSSPRGKEFADYYSDFDDGQRFDDEEYETTFIKPGMHYGDNVEIVEQLMVRGDDDDVGGAGAARRALVTSRRRRRRRRPRPLRRRRVRLTHRRAPRRLLRVPGKVNTRLNRIRLSRDNIQLHPTISRTPLTSASSGVPRVVSYTQPGAQYVSKLTGAVQYVTVPAGYTVDTSSQATPVVIQLQKPLSSSSSSTLDSRLGLVSTSPEDIQVIELADRKATTSLGYRHEGNYATMTDGAVAFPVAVRQSSLDSASVPAQEIVVPLSSGSGQPAGGIQLVMPIKNPSEQLSPATVQLLTTNTDDLTLLPVQTVHDRDDSRPSGTLRTLPDVTTSSPTYIIFKLSGNGGTEASENTRRRSGGEIVAGQSVELGDKVKYVDLSALLSKSHLSVTSPSPTASRRRPPTTSRRRPTRPRTATKPAARRRLRRPPPPAGASQTPQSSPLSRQRTRPVPPRPLPAPAPHQEPRNDQPYSHDQRRFDLPSYNTDRHRYQPSPAASHQQYRQQQQQQYSAFNQHHRHAQSLSPRHEASSEAILPRFRPTRV